MLWFAMFVGVFVSLLLSGKRASAAVVLPYVDRKGEKGKVTFTQIDALPDQAALVSWWSDHSYAGISSFTELASTVLTTPVPPETTALIENDKDMKLCLGFQGAEGHFKIEIPCPKINVEGGFIIRWGENRAFVPPVAAQGEIGDDGNTIAAALAGYFGQTEGNPITFSYGRLVKQG